MRMPTLAIFLTTATVLTAAPARAQTYDPAYPVCLHVYGRGGQLLRMPLHVAASVQRVGIGPRRPVRHQSIFCERANIRGTTLPAVSPGLLDVLRLSGSSNVCCWKKSGKYLLAASISPFDPDRTSIAGPQLFPAVYASAATGLRTSKNAAAATMQRAPAIRNAGP